MKHLRTLAYLLVGLIFISYALVLQDDMYALGMRYYLYLSQGLRQEAGGVQSPDFIPNCELENVFRQLADTGEGGGVGVGPCDVVMISGLVAAGGFLAYLMVYFAVVGAVWLFLQPLPTRWRRPALAVASVAFLFVALPARPAIWFLEFAVAACLLASLPVPRQWRAALLPLALLAFLVGAGKPILALCSREFFQIHRLYFGAGGEDAVSPFLRDIIQFVNLGSLGVVGREGEGFPYILPALGLLITLPRRIAWLSYELWVGRLSDVGALDGFLYLLGLPFLIGNAASPSFEDFAGSYGRGPGPEKGGATLAWCLGFGTLGYVALLALGYSPAVRLLFPRCDLNLVSPMWVWGRLVVMYLVTYLYLLSTEQVSVGVCRIYGYGVPDNYEGPLLARNVADYWRRWNVLWRNFLVTVFFLPTALALGRRQRRSATWHLAVATGVTFLGTWTLNALPLAILSGFGRSRLLMSEAAKPGPGLTDTVNLDPSVTLAALLPALLIYYALEGAAVALNLFVEAKKPKSLPRLPRPVAVVFTFLFVAAARAFVDPSMNLTEKFSLLRRAFGLEG